MSISSLKQLAREAAADYAGQGLYGKIDLNDPTFFALKIFEYPNPNSLVIEDLKENEALSHRLNASLDESSRKKLKVLKLRNKVPFPKEWAATIQLPSLETLLIGSITQFQFSNFCRNFHSLRVFDISWFCGISLDGIGELKNLEVLSARNQYMLKTPESIMPIFECTKLKVLDLSRDLDDSQIVGECDVVANYLKCNKVLPELVHLDCKRLDLNRGKLTTLLNGHKSLKQIVALNTTLDYAVHPGVQLLNRASAQSVINCFKHYLDMGNKDSIELLLTGLDTLVAVHFAQSEEQILVESMIILCRMLKDFGSTKRIFVHGVKALNGIMRLLYGIDLEQEHYLMVADQLISSGTYWMNNKSTPVAFHTLWRLLGSLPLKGIPILMARRLIAFASKYLKVGDHPFARIMLTMLPRKFNAKDLLAVWPRSEVFESLVAWIDLEPLSRLDDVLELCSDPKIVERLASESVHKQILVFWNSKELTDEQIKSMRDLMQKEKKKIDLKFLAEYMVSKTPKLLKNFNSTAFFAMEFLVTLLLSEASSKVEDQEIWSRVDAELQNLCLAFQKSGRKFPHFPGIQILQDALKVTKYDAPALWALMMIRMMMWNLNRSHDSRKHWLGREILNVKNRPKMVMDVREDVINRWKPVHLDPCGI